MRRDWLWFWVPAIAGAGVTAMLVATGLKSDQALTVMGGIALAGLVLQTMRVRVR